MNIKVLKLSMTDYMDITGGECASVVVEILVDDKLPHRVQRNLVLHAVIETYFPSMVHDKVEELTDYISDALDELED